MSAKNHSEIIQRLRIVQNMRSILIQAPSEELRKLVVAQHATETNPEMRAFLNLMISDNQANRDLAAGVFKEMADKLLADEAALPPVVEKVAEVAAPSAPVEVVAPVVRTPTAIDAEIAHMAEAALQATATAPAKALAPMGIDAVIADPVAVPFQDSTDVLETVGWSLSEPNQEAGPSKTYSIIRSQTPDALLAGTRLTHLTGLVFGIAGQDKIQHGFGFICPLSEKFAAIPTEGSARCTMNIRLQLPQALPIWDEHELISSPVVAYYHAAYQAMVAGYRFLLDVEIIPFKGSFVCSLSPDIKIEHTSGVVRVVDLASLQFAANRLTFVGFTAEGIPRG